jgi:hypothetical protein
MNTFPPKAAPLSLDDLPRQSPWPAILLGATPFTARHRTKEGLQREYGQEKWGKVLAWLKSHDSATEADLLRLQGLEPDSIIAFSEDAAFFTAPAAQVFESYRQCLLGVLRRYREEEALVELGSGLGDKLLRFAAELKPRLALGGEFTPSGVECGSILTRQRRINATFVPFDFYEPRSVDFIPPGALVYTAHAIEQVPQLPEAFVEALLQRRPRTVVHFEPCYDERNDSSLVGLMRRRYTEINDYNRNLVPLLRRFEAQGKIRIVEHKADIFAVSPLNSTSVLVWQPADGGRTA